MHAIGEGLILTLEDESVMSGTLAKVLVTKGEDTVLAEVTGEVTSRQGADGGYCPAVRLRLKEAEDGREGEKATVPNAGPSANQPE